MTLGRSVEASLLDKLRELVLSGEYPPGSPISEQRLTEAFHVSRTPVREALKQLQNEGLVEIRSKVGTFVREPTRREVAELFEVKEALEGLAAGLMAKRGPIEELDILRANLAESDAAVRANNVTKYVALVKQFHETIVEGSDNSKLVEHYRRLMNQLAYQRLVLRTVEHPGRLAVSTAEHQRVVDLIEAKDSWGAERAMRMHVQASSQEALNVPS
ncbi:GntR family transcriptional regulator [Rhodococcoides kyotonense]|uniref:DNA-binding transcriptional regulator, GntR family n=1 Tax=Rhodococcoides kyotonense TaxID=398843 RepID=A0A239LHQ5_9NOCA|nr:GntR family transcriptional regulator [Rhodococcus kyotonensis]SNT29452.1 DNA-binding transcriptional regulator, GntR family [Rhodococcus kyotonensis]